MEQDKVKDLSQEQLSINDLVTQLALENPKKGLEIAKQLINKAEDSILRNEIEKRMHNYKYAIDVKSGAHMIDDMVDYVKSQLSLVYYTAFKNGTGYQSHIDIKLLEETLRNNQLQNVSENNVTDEVQNLSKGSIEQQLDENVTSEQSPSSQE